uniref:Dnajc5 protein n=1 Tax=Mus musculus TaxID=10090 RepID=Q8K1C3_MOUSE|nr:Dnajc5 protein [Mus musculus]
MILCNVYDLSYPSNVQLTQPVPNGEKPGWVMVADALCPSTWEAEAGGSRSLFYRTSSRTARTTHKEILS